MVLGSTVIKIAATGHVETVILMSDCVLGQLRKRRPEIDNS